MAGLFAHVDLFERRCHSLVLEPVTRNMLWPYVPMDKPRCESKPERILRLRGCLWQPCKKLSRFCKGAHVNTFDISLTQLMRFEQSSKRINRRMSPAADRVGLDVVQLNSPKLPQIGPMRRSLFSLHGNRGRTLKAVFCHQHSHRPHKRAHARTVMKHGGCCDFTHHLAAGPVVFCYAKRLAQHFGAITTQPATKSRYSQRVPRTRSMIVAHARM